MITIYKPVEQHDLITYVIYLVPALEGFNNVGFNNFGWQRKERFWANENRIWHSDGFPQLLFS